MPRKTHAHRPRLRTLFDTHFVAHSQQFRRYKFPYCLCVQALARSEDRRFAPYEADILADVLEHELQYHLPRGSLIGPLVMRDPSGRRRDLSRARSAFPIPRWVERDALELCSSSARGVLVVDSARLFARLCAQRAWRQLDVLLANSVGLPRAGMRRLLHRLSTELALPVYLLVDNDTWGYFAFFLLKQGMVHPTEAFMPLAVTDLRLLGIRAGDAAGVRAAVRPWKAQWDVRLRCMAAYDCFSGAEWKSEFDAFRKQRGAIDAEKFWTHVGESEFISRYVLRWLDESRWLC